MGLYYFVIIIEIDIYVGNNNTFSFFPHINRMIQHSKLFIFVTASLETVRGIEL